MTKCIVCGGTVQNEEYSICRNCIKTNVTLDNVLKFGAEWQDEVSINSFLASYFKGHIDELEEILIAEILRKYENDPDMVKESVQEYIGEDPDSFICWLEVKWNAKR